MSLRHPAAAGCTRASPRDRQTGLLQIQDDGQNTKTRRLFCPTSPVLRSKIFIFPKDRIYDLKKPARLDTGDVLAIRHQT
jgi:hypothetical protein